MDLVDFKEEAYERIKVEVKDFVSKLTVHDLDFIPMYSAVPWWDGHPDSSLRLAWVSVVG